MSRRPGLQRAEPQTFTQEKDAAGHVHAHALVPHKFSTVAHRGLPAWCECCEKFIFSSKLARCAACNVAVHRSCRGAFVRLHHSCLQRRTDEILNNNNSNNNSNGKTKKQGSKGPTASAVTAAAAAPPLEKFWAHRLHFDPSVPLVPDAVEQMLGWLRSHRAVADEGLFRLAGAGDTVDQISRRFLAGEPLRLESIKGLDSHDVASALKRWFRELPEPIATFELYDAFIAATELVLAKKTSAESLDVLRRALAALPPGCWATLRALFKLLHAVAQNAAQNKMTPSNLAIVFAPNLLRANTDDPLVLMMGMQRASQFVELLIVNWPALDDEPEDDDDDGDAMDDDDDDEDDVVVHSAEEIQVVAPAATIRVVQVAQVAQAEAVVPAAHHAAIVHMPTLKETQHPARSLQRTTAVPKVNRPSSPAPLPPKLVRMPSDRMTRLREKAQLIKQASDRITPPGQTDAKSVKHAAKLESAATAAASPKPPLDELPSSEELHRWESVLCVLEGAGTTSAAAPPPLPPAQDDDDNDDDEEDESSSGDDHDILAAPELPQLDAASETSLTQAFQTLIDVATVRIAARALATRRELGDMAKSGHTTLMDIVNADPYNQAHERKLAEKFPAASANQIKLALRLAGNNYDEAVKAMAHATPAAAAAATPEHAAEKARPSQSRIGARRSDKALAMKRGSAVACGVSQSLAAVAPQPQPQPAAPVLAVPAAPKIVVAVDEELSKLTALLGQIAATDTDLTTWVEREALANPKLSDVDDDGVWRGLPGDVAKAVKLVETQFASAGRNIDKFMSKLASVPDHGRSHEQLYDDISHLLRLVERNAERRAAKIQTMIRERQGQLKAQELWIFSGDRSKRIQAALQQRRELHLRRDQPAVPQVAKEDKQ